MTKFSFRQRVGKINWNIVSAVSIQDVVENLQVNELQAVLDAVTFCEFGPSDIRNCPIESVAQLVHIFQFTIEFLLHSQEAQNVLIDKMHKRSIGMKDSNRQLSVQVMSLKEDTKIYQRQLSVLRQSMNIREPQHPKVSELRNPKRESSEIQPIVASVLQSEKESRAHLRDLLEDQRIAFMKELELNRIASHAASTAAAKSQTNSSSVSNQDSMERLMTQMKDIMKEQQEQQRAIITAALSSRSIQNENINKPRDEDPYISGALPNERELRARIIQEEKTRIQEEFKKKSSELAAREETLLLNLRDFKNLQKVKEDKERAKVYLSSIDSLAMLKPHDERGIISLREKSRAVSVMTIKSQLRIALTRQVSKAFRIWTSKVAEYKERTQIEEHSRLLSSHSNSHARRERELLELVQNEKHKAIIEVARMSVLNKNSERGERQDLLIDETAKRMSPDRSATTYPSASQVLIPSAIPAPPPPPPVRHLVDTNPAVSGPRISLDPWLAASMKMRLGAALTGDEAYKMAQERISEKRLSVKADYHAKEQMNILASEVASRLKIADLPNIHPSEYR